MKQLPLIEILQKLQPTFIKAGELACKMQKGVHHHNKFNSGNHAADIVTEADLAVQELLLGAISKTDLINCQLLGEEDTPLTKKFNNQDRKSTRLNSSHQIISYAVFCLKKKKNYNEYTDVRTQTTPIIQKTTDHDTKSYHDHRNSQETDRRGKPSNNLGHKASEASSHVH